MAHPVKCLYCGQTFDRDKIDFIEIRPRRYAHKECPIISKEEQKKISKNETDKDAFWQYIKKLYGPKYNYVKLNIFAEKYIKEYNFTWNGMLKALKWYYEIKHNKNTIDYESIGILPYIYDDAKKYYYNIYLTQKKNKDKKVNTQSQKIINIQSPKNFCPSRQLFDLED